MSCFIDLGRKQTEMFIINNVGYCELLVTAKVPRMIMNLAYSSLVRQNKITPIEKLSQEDKKMSWNTAKDFSKGRLSDLELVEVVKALHALEFLL